MRVEPEAAKNTGDAWSSMSLGQDSEKRRH